jgi:hypothetical protein
MGDVSLPSWQGSDLKDRMRPVYTASQEFLSKEGKKTVIPLDEALGLDRLSHRLSPEMMLWSANRALRKGSFEASQPALEQIQLGIGKEPITINDDTIRKVSLHHRRDGLTLTT